MDMKNHKSGLISYFERNVILDYDIDKESLGKDYNRIRQYIFLEPLTFVDFIQNPFHLKRLSNAYHTPSI